jgi:predicted MFS family arabinose efflux permease
VPATALAIISVSFALKLPNSASADFLAKLKRVDFVGAMTLVAMIFSLLLGLDLGGNSSWSDKFTILALIAFLILFGLFCVIETKLASEPIAPQRIIANRALIASYMVNLLGVASIYAMIFYTSLFLQAVLQKSPSESGLWLLPAIGSGVLGSLSGGLIIQVTGKYYWLTVGANTVSLFGTVLATLCTGVLITSPLGLSIGMYFSVLILQFLSSKFNLILEGLALTSLGNGLKFHIFNLCESFMKYLSGAAVATCLVSLISNAGPNDRAIATAGTCPNFIS